MAATSASGSIGTGDSTDIAGLLPAHQLCQLIEPAPAMARTSWPFGRDERLDQASADAFEPEGGRVTARGVETLGDLQDLGDDIKCEVLADADSLVAGHACKTRRRASPRSPRGRARSPARQPPGPAAGSPRPSRLPPPAGATPLLRTPLLRTPLACGCDHPRQANREESPSRPPSDLAQRRSCRTYRSGAVPLRDCPVRGDRPVKGPSQEPPGPHTSGHG